MNELTGRHVFAITASAFAVIIGVNLLLAWKAVSTFPGVEVDSSYQAGVGFDSRRAAQVALGWTVTTTHDGQIMHLAFADKAGSVQPQNLTVKIGRVTEAGQDRTVNLVWNGADFSGQVPLDPGLWRVDVNAAAADNTPFLQQLRLVIRK
jgi:nitrogen fixation protein FixH